MTITNMARRGPRIIRVARLPCQLANQGENEIFFVAKGDFAQISCTNRRFADLPAAISPSPKPQDQSARHEDPYRWGTTLVSLPSARR